MISQLKKASLLLENLSRYSGCAFVWRFVGGDPPAEIQPGQIAHQGAFCCKIKSGPCGKLHLCIRDHQANAFTQALLERKPFLLHCHAGAVDIAVPFFSGNTLLGVLFAGPYRDISAHTLKYAEEEYERLPLVEPEKLLQFGTFLDSMMSLLFSEIKMPAESSKLCPGIRSDDARIIRAASYMRGRCKEKITAAQAARIAGLSTSRFLHLFSLETGFSFSDWIQRLRLSEALRLIEGTDIPLGIISDACGFSDQSRMIALFRRYVGKTPYALRCEKRQIRGVE